MCKEGFLALCLMVLQVLARGEPTKSLRRIDVVIDPFRRQEGLVETGVPQIT